MTMSSSLSFTKELLVSWSDGSILLICQALNQIVCMSLSPTSGAALLVEEVWRGNTTPLLGKCL